MKVLMISTDSNILAEGSEVRSRMLWYANALERLDILLITKKANRQNKVIKVGDKVTVYPRRFWQAPTWKQGFQVGEVDVISAQDPFENGLIGWWLARRYKLSLQLQIHTDLLSPYFWRESLKNKIRLTMAKWLLFEAKNIRVVSQKIKDSLIYQLKVAPEKITVLPVWIDLAAHQKSGVAANLKQFYPQFNKIILVASRLTREKNIQMVIEAMDHIISQVPGVGLVIVGDGSELGKLKSQVNDLKLERRVEFFGWANDLIPLYQTADVFVNTSWYEGFGRTIIEALAAGCPVVSTDVGVAAEAGAVISDFTAEDLSNKIVEVLADPQKVNLSDQFKLTPADYLKQFIESFKI